MNPNDMVRFNYSPSLVLYGIIIYIKEDMARVEYKKPPEGELDYKWILLTELVKIGNNVGRYGK